MDTYARIHGSIRHEEINYTDFTVDLGSFVANIIYG